MRIHKALPFLRSDLWIALVFFLYDLVWGGCPSGAQELSPGWSAAEPWDNMEMIRKAREAAGANGVVFCVTRYAGLDHSWYSYPGFRSYLATPLG